MVHINYDIVISHYNEDLSWLTDVDSKRINVYSKSNIESTLNIGNEATAYLQFIVDNYNSFKNNPEEYVYFCHGHNESGHQDYSNKYIIENIDISKIEGFLNVNNYYNIISDIKTVTLLRYENITDNKPYCILQDFFNTFFGKYKKMPITISSYSSAQFFVVKKLILSNTKEFYEECLNWFYSGDADKLDKKFNTSNSVYSSRCFEWLWFYIFTGLHTEKIINLEKFFYGK